MEGSQCAFPSDGTGLVNRRSNSAIVIMHSENPISVAMTILIRNSSAIMSVVAIVPKDILPGIEWFRSRVIEGRIEKPGIPGAGGPAQKT